MALGNKPLFVFWKKKIKTICNTLKGARYSKRSSCFYYKTSSSVWLKFLFQYLRNCASLSSQPFLCFVLAWCSQQHKHHIKHNRCAGLKANDGLPFALCVRQETIPSPPHLWVTRGGLTQQDLFSTLRLPVGRVTKMVASRGKQGTCKRRFILIFKSNYGKLLHGKQRSYY